MSPKIHEIAGSGLERAANLLLKLCQQNEMEKHGKLNEIQCQTETESRSMWDIVDEVYRDWKVSPPPKTVSTSVNGILGASYGFLGRGRGRGGRPPDLSCRGAGMAGAAHNVLEDDNQVGPRTTRKVADLHAWQVTGIGIIVGYASRQG